jgi:hypothetical protein
MTDTFRMTALVAGILYLVTFASSIPAVFLQERERLWAGFREYPGWGDDLDGLAARRSAQRAVVVLEPRPVAVVRPLP